MNDINTLQKEQIKSLYSQAYVASLAVLGAGLLVGAVFYEAGQLEYIGWFVSILIVAIGLRVLLTNYFNKNKDERFSIFAALYVVATLALGLDFAFISLVYYDLQNQELRTFLTIVNLGLITAGVGTLAVWFRAYLAFALPQIFALMALFILNDSIYTAIAVIVYSSFMLVVARNFNANFKKGRLLIEENRTLIENMESEITSRKDVQLKLESYQIKLEDLVNARTKELSDANNYLKHQIEKRSEVEKELEYLAYYDVLTGIPNRTLFIERTKQAIAFAKRNQSLFSILIIDLDRFKAVNDTMGRAVGDKVIVQIAERLKNALRESDTVARIDGDEFVVLADNLANIREAIIVAEKIINTISESFKIDGHDIHISMSVGLSIYPFDSVDALELLKHSDTAMYSAKEKGTNRFEFYSSEMSSEINARLKLEYALRTALQNNEFNLVFQPQVNIVTHQTSGFEALLRWNSPDLGPISPVVFIPILEETGLIYSVGEWVILEVIDFIKSGVSQNTKVSINLSALQCGVPGYSNKIKRFITKAKIDPKLIEFEVTESLLINDFSKTEKFLTDISKLGCTIALDDFGTGYTSFAYLTKLPIDIIKIDRSLVTGIEHNKNLQDIVHAIVTMSESLNIENIFEGVETEEELRMVKKLNGKIIQGYLFSKPIEKSLISDWFENGLKVKMANAS